MAFDRVILSLCFCFVSASLPSQALTRQLSHRESPWQAGPLPTGCLRPDMAQKGGPCYRGQRLLDKRTLSSCRESRQRSTTVSEKIRLCSSSVGLTGLPMALPLGELAGASPTERASHLSQSRCTAISRLFVRAILSQCKSCLSASLPSPSLLRNATSPKGRGFGRPEGVKNPFRRLLLREGWVILRSSTFYSILRSESNIASFAKLDFRAKLEHRK